MPTSDQREEGAEEIGMFTINRTLTEYPVLVKNVTLHLDEKTDFDVNVPVFNVKTEQDIFDAIVQRETFEKRLYVSAVEFLTTRQNAEGLVK